jgi:AraC-like DNA-binding protein
MNKNNLILKWDELSDIAHCPADDEGCPIIAMFTPQASTAVHSHEFYELVYVREGFCLHFINEKGNLLMPGDFLILPPGIDHSYRCKSDIDIVNIMFLPEVLGDDFHEIISLLNIASVENTNVFMPHASFLLPDREKIKSLLKELTNEREYKLLGWKLRSKALLLDLIVLAGRVFSSHLSYRLYGNSYMNNMLSVITMIEERYAKNISVKDLAASLDISHDHFTRQFKKATGFTPSEYLQRRRFAKALELLHTNTPVSYVAHVTGFGQISYFSREFKKLFGMTPTEFQKQCRE